jgi:hypothetical protein
VYHGPRPKQRIPLATLSGRQRHLESDRGQFTQRDRDGSVLSGLPAVVGGVNSGVATGAQQAPVNLTQAQTAAYLDVFNHPCIGRSFSGEAI